METAISLPLFPSTLCRMVCAVFRTLRIPIFNSSFFAGPPKPFLVDAPPKKPTSFAISTGSALPAVEPPPSMPSRRQPRGPGDQAPSSPSAPSPSQPRVSQPTSAPLIDLLSLDDFAPVAQPTRPPQQVTQSWSAQPSQPASGLDFFPSLQSTPSAQSSSYAFTSSSAGAPPLEQGFVSHGGGTGQGGFASFGQPGPSSGFSAPAPSFSGQMQYAPTNPFADPFASTAQQQHSQPQQQSSYYPSGSQSTNPFF